jgi:hypothetical protein
LSFIADGLPGFQARDDQLYGQIANATANDYPEYWLRRGPDAGDSPGSDLRM